MFERYDDVVCWVQDRAGDVIDAQASFRRGVVALVLHLAVPALALAGTVLVRHPDVDLRSLGRVLLILGGAALLICVLSWTPLWPRGRSDATEG